MYDWEQIALMYKEEVSELHEEIFQGTEILRTALPNCNNKAAATLLKSLKDSELNFGNIEVFENLVKEKSPNILEKTKRRGILRAGAIVDKTYNIEDCDKIYLDEICACGDYKKQAIMFAEKSSVLYALSWLKDASYQIIDKGVVENKSNSFRVVHTPTKKMYTANVICSPIELGGTARELDGTKIGNIIKQRLYLVDIDSPREDIFVFCDYNQAGTVTVYAWVKGKYIDRMMIEPIRERFQGKKGCIVKDGITTGKEFPCSINGLLRRDK